jgi:hypothetical protein
MIDWLLSAEGITTIVLVLTLIVLILTFQHAHRPYVGVISVDTSYNQNTKDLVLNVKIKNTGNVPANNVHSNMAMYIDGKEIGSNEGESKYVLFPGQETSGIPAFHGVLADHIERSKLRVKIEIYYQQPVNSFIRIPVMIRKFETVHELDYEPKSKKFAMSTGVAN